MASELLPAINSSGQWQLKAPFDTKVLPGMAYACKEIRKLSAVLATGIEALEQYYLAYGLTEDVYKQHIADDVSLITLVSASGNWVVVPSPYIDGWPSSDVVPYVVLGMVVILGALPNTIDPGFLESKVANVIKNSLGHEPQIQFTAMSDVSNVPFIQHESLENLRKANITDDNTDYIRRSNAEAELVKARATIASLQKFIIDSGIDIPIVSG